MYTSIQMFAQDWKNESANTQKLMDVLNDASLAQEVTTEGRTLGRLAWHIVTSVHEMLSRTGLEFDAPHHDAPVPTSAQVIADGYRQASQAVLESLNRNWSDATLNETCDMYGEQWPKGLTLQILIGHQTHHRGQMTVLMRQAGLQVPGVFGPSREEWIQMGMEPPAV